VKSLLALLLVIAFATPEAFAQANNGELRLSVVDPFGLGIKAAVQITSEANQYHIVLATDNQAHAVAQRLPFGKYEVAVSRSGSRTSSTRLTSVASSRAMLSARRAASPFD
jgi:hypothetical protein